MIQRFDFATYVKTVYTDRAFDLTSESLSNAFDPTVGVQRVYWSKNYKIGLPFSNSAHYQSAEADSLLESGAVESDPAERHDIFNRFQAVINRDLPVINLVAPYEVIIANRRVRNYAPGAEGLNGNFAGVYLEA